MTVPGNRGLGCPANAPSSFSFFSFQVRQTVQATSYSLGAGAVVAPVVALARQVTSHAALVPLGSCQSHVRLSPAPVRYLEWRFRKATWTTVDRHSNGLHRASAFSAREAKSISSSTAASFRPRCHLPGACPTPFLTLPALRGAGGGVAAGPRELWGAGWRKPPSGSRRSDSVLIPSISLPSSMQVLDVLVLPTPIMGGQYPGQRQ